MMDLMRAAHRLDLLADDAFFVEMSEGLRLIAENGASYSSDRRVLAEAGRTRGADLAHVLAQEEAAKFLILLDVVRCPRSGGRRAAHLKNFYSHFAKGIYVVSLVWRPSNFADLRRYIDQDRDRFYLDGPMNVDWVFRNQILEERERLLYVDYIDAWDGQLRWISPLTSGNEFGGLSIHSEIVELVLAMNALGFSHPNALSIIARRWRDAEISDEMWVDPELYEANRQTLLDLHKACALVTPTDEACRLVIERWPFPMYSIDFRLRDVTPADVQRQREEALLREMGEWVEPA